MSLSPHLVAVKWGRCVYDVELLLELLLPLVSLVVLRLLVLLLELLVVIV